MGEETNRRLDKLEAIVKAMQHNQAPTIPQYDLQAPSGGGGGGVGAWTMGYSDHIAGSDPTQPVNSGANVHGYFAHTATTDSSILSWSTQSNDFDLLNMNAPGVYLLLLTVEWNSTGSLGDTNSILLHHSGQTGTIHSGWQGDSFGATTFDNPGQASHWDMNIIHVTSSSVYKAFHTNNLGFNTWIDRQYLTAMYIPTA